MDIHHLQETFQFCYSYELLVLHSFIYTILQSNSRK